MKRFDDDDARWHAVLARDPAADGAFLYGVASTRIFCRPTCPARRPQRRNVRFFADAAAARTAGFRACLRCEPTRPATARAPEAAVLAACRIMAQRETPPTLSELAAEVGYSPTHFQRLFQRIVGVSPRAYAAQLRQQRLRAQLPARGHLTDAIHAAGYGAASRFYEADAPALGMAPQRAAAGGAGETLRVAAAPCVLGWLGAALSERGLCAVELGDSERAVLDALQERLPRATHTRDAAALAPWLEALRALAAGEPCSTVLPLDVRGTAFQRRVWAALRATRPGAQLSYGALAAALGQPGASRAVAQACAANPLALAVPCHRIVRADGTAGGYRWGAARKGALLAQEAEATARLDAAP